MNALTQIARGVVPGGPKSIVAMFNSWRFHRALKDARRLRSEARARVLDAETRNDTRDLGRARMWLERATTDVLRLELGSR